MVGHRNNEECGHTEGDSKGGVELQGEELADQVREHGGRGVEGLGVGGGAQAQATFWSFSCAVILHSGQTRILLSLRVEQLEMSFGSVV